jgi:hypothetical protein
VKLPPLRMPSFELPAPAPLRREGAPSYELPPVRQEAVHALRAPSLPTPSLSPSLSASLSMTPAGLRKGPSWKFWGAALACGLAIGTAFALRWGAHHEPPHVRAASKPAPVAPQPLPEPDPLPVAPQGELPYGALPPESTPEQERAAPPVRAEDAREPKRRAREPRPAQVAAPAPPEPRAPAPPPAPKSAPESGDKLLRSLDF